MRADARGQVDARLGGGDRGRHLEAGAGPLPLGAVRGVACFGLALLVGWLGCRSGGSRGWCLRVPTPIPINSTKPNRELKWPWTDNPTTPKPYPTPNPNATCLPTPNTKTPNSELKCTWTNVVKLGQSLYREAPGMDVYRPRQKSPVQNFYLAGSYTYQVRMSVCVSICVGCNRGGDGRSTFGPFPPSLDLTISPPTTPTPRNHDRTTSTRWRAPPSRASSAPTRS